VILLAGHDNNVNWVAFSRDGQRLASRSHDGTVRLWNLATGTQRAVLNDHDGDVPIAALSPDGARLATLGGDDMLRVWDVASCTEVARRDAMTDNVRSLIFTNDGQRLLFGAGNTKRGWLREWSIAEKGQPRTVMFPASVWAAALSPDDRYLAVGLATKPGEVRILDASNMTELHVATQARRVRALAYSPTGDVIASADRFDINLWKPSLEPPLRLQGHMKVVLGLCFSPDGQTLASTSEDDTLRLWDVATGTTLRCIEPDNLGAACSVAISADGALIAVGGLGEIGVWRMEELMGVERG
jgi:WD40 repeat protein